MDAINDFNRKKIDFDKARLDAIEDIEYYLDFLNEVLDGIDIESLPWYARCQLYALRKKAKCLDGRCYQ